MKSNLEIMQVLVVSTAHVTEQEAATLSAGEPIGHTMPSPMHWYGFILMVSGIEDPRAEGLSDGLCDVITVAREAGIGWVRFDADGPVLDNCATYEW